MMKTFRGQDVCVLGKIQKQAPDQSTFELVAADGEIVMVKLKAPINERLSNIVEVYGKVDERGSLICTDMATFEEHLIQNFDMDLYNEAIKITNSVPKHYPCVIEE